MQIKPSLSTTKFHEGFYRRPQSQIRQDEARKFEEEYTVLFSSNSLKHKFCNTLLENSKTATA